MIEPICFTIKMLPYPFRVLISFNQSDEEFIKSVKKAKGDMWNNEFFFEKEGMSCVSHDRNTYETTARFTKFKKDAISYGCLVHEIFHIVELVFRSAGLPHDVKHSSEAYSYMVGYLAEVTFKKLGYK